MNTAPMRPDVFQINFKECPSFKDLFEICKEYYVVQCASSNGIYGIVLELRGNGRINKFIENA